MPTRNAQVKSETRVGKVAQAAVRSQLNALPVAGQGTPEVFHQPPAPTSVSPEVVISPAQAGDPGNGVLFVPVVSSTGMPLMPCHPARARELVRKGRAVRRFKSGMFYVKLVDRSTGDVQPVAVGIDPGSKKEGYTVKSDVRTFTNVQADAVTWVKDVVETRRQMRRTRRNRKTPCRQNRQNRSRGTLPPSTRARWDWKLRFSRHLSKLFPVSRFVVEDIKAKTKGKRRWDASFSPLEVGKKWFYEELGKLAPVETKGGWETKEMRDAARLKKTKAKMSERFDAHCVDSWVLANSYTGGHVVPDNTRLFCVTPLRFHRRQLHVLQPAADGIRRTYGSTRSEGFKRGSLVKHPKWGLAYVGGFTNGRVSLHSTEDGVRLCQNAKPSDIQFLAHASWRTRLLPRLKSGVSAA